MNQRALDGVAEIQQKLDSILSKVSGKFSIEQQVLDTRECEAVLLKIYQYTYGDESKKIPILILVVDGKLKMGVCEEKILRNGINPLTVKFRKSYNQQNFAPWVRSLLAPRLTQLAA